jgi:hypothetical protein
MQNFGRGMWRRLNDYDVINQVNRQNNQVKEYLAYKEYQLKLKRQLQINAYREKILLEKRRESELEQIKQQNFVPNNDIREESVYFEIASVEYDIPIEMNLEVQIEEEQHIESIIDDKIKVIEVIEESKNENKIIPRKLKKKNKK